jgi:hypothetical protein
MKKIHLINSLASEPVFRIRIHYSDILLNKDSDPDLGCFLLRVKSGFGQRYFMTQKKTKKKNSVVDPH